MTTVEFEGGIAMYAAVDMSKKKNRSCADEDEDDIADSSLPMYSVVDSLPTYSVVDKKKRKPEPIAPYNPALKKNATEASMMTMDNLYKTENVKQSPVKANTMFDTSKKIIAKPQFYCKSSIVLAVVLAVMSVILIICFAILGSTITTNSSLKSEIQSLQQQKEVCQNALAVIESQGLSPENAVVSCAALLHYLPSGYYWVRAYNGSAVPVYCDMTIMSCGNVTGGWMRVVELNMTNSSHKCPSGLRQRNDTNIRTCVRSLNSSGCSPVVIFPTTSISYLRVCGRITAYQKGSTNAFERKNTLNNNYVDGVSLTHGNQTQHIWTFAAALDETNVTDTRASKCVCINTGTSEPPGFVDDDYFCDTGSQQGYTSGMFYGADPLWDGAGCGPSSSCCTFNNPPWFYKQLPQPTTDDIEMRVCRDDPASLEDVAIEMIEIYVQ